MNNLSPIRELSTISNYDEAVLSLEWFFWNILFRNGLLYYLDFQTDSCLSYLGNPNSLVVPCKKNLKITKIVHCKIAKISKIVKISKLCRLAKLPDVKTDTSKICQLKSLRHASNPRCQLHFWLNRVQNPIPCTSSRHLDKKMKKKSTMFDCIKTFPKENKA